MSFYNYIHWQDYYREFWQPSYSKIIEIKDKDSHIENKEKCLKDFVTFFYTTCKLIKYYLENNGLFFKNYKRSIMAAFNIGLIEDGDTWAEIFALITRDSTKSSKMQEVLDFCLGDNFYIFNDLNNKFVKLLESYE